jgi:hypothetical protein
MPYTTIRINLIDEHGRGHPVDFDVINGGDYQKLMLPPVTRVLEVPNRFGLIAIKSIEANVPIVQTARLKPYQENGSKLDDYAFEIDKKVFLPVNVTVNGVQKENGDLYENGDISNDLSLVNSAYPYEEIESAFSKTYVSTLEDYNHVCLKAKKCHVQEQERENVAFFPFYDEKTYAGKTTKPIKAGQELFTSYGASYWMKKLSKKRNQKIRLAAYYVNAFNGLAPNQPNATFAIAHHEPGQKYVLISRSDITPKNIGLDRALINGIVYLTTQFDALPEDAYKFLVTPFFDAASNESARKEMIKASLPLKRRSDQYKQALRDFRAARVAFTGRSY